MGVYVEPLSIGGSGKKVDFDALGAKVCMGEIQEWLEMQVWKFLVDSNETTTRYHR